MPIYEYKCTSCGNKNEVLQKLSDAPLKQCPECGKATLLKLISAAGFQLKGSGWYATDFKGGAKAAKSGEDKGDNKAGAETKPAGDAKPGGDANKGDSKPSGENQVKGEGKVKDDAKPAAPASAAGTTPAGQ